MRSWCSVLVRSRLQKGMNNQNKATSMEAPWKLCYIQLKKTKMLIVNWDDSKNTWVPSSNIFKCCCVDFILSICIMELKEHKSAPRCHLLPSCGSIITAVIVGRVRRIMHVQNPIRVCASDGHVISVNPEGEVRPKG